ncbi:MAG: cobalt ECF transporter T component CbiQ [Thermoleophilia bacterium]
MHLIDRIATTNRLAAVCGLEKLGFALGMLLLALLLPPLPGALVVLAVVMLATLVVARVPARSYLTLMAGPLTFLVLGLVPLLVTVGLGGPWFVRIGLAAGGPQLALGVGLRSLAGTSCLLFLALSTPVPQFLGVLRRLHTPAVVTEVALLVYRYIWVFLGTVESIRVAQASRLGYCSFSRSYRSLAMLAAAFFAQTLQRARAMDHGLQARNWQGELRVLEDAAGATLLGVSLVAVTLLSTLSASVLWQRL